MNQTNVLTTTGKIPSEIRTVVYCQTDIHLNLYFWLLQSHPLTLGQYLISMIITFTKTGQTRACVVIIPDSTEWKGIESYKSYGNISFIMITL